MGLKLGDFLLPISVPGNVRHFLKSSALCLNVACYILPSFLRGMCVEVGWVWVYTRDLQYLQDITLLK